MKGKEVKNAGRRSAALSSYTSTLTCSVPGKALYISDEDSLDTAQ